MNIYDPVVRGTLKAITATHRVVHRATRGRVSAPLPGRGSLVWFTVIGRKSGLPRSVPLMGVPEHDGPDTSWLIAGSNGGQSTAPVWVLNARANAKGELEARGERFSVRIEELTDDEERARAYAFMTSAWRWYASYARRVHRRIPVFRLHRLDGG